MSERKATVERNTKETQIKVSLVLEGQGKSKHDIGIPFLEHMLAQIARHGLFDLEIKAKGQFLLGAQSLLLNNHGLTRGQEGRQGLLKTKGQLIF